MRHNRTVDRVAEERAGPVEDYGSLRSRGMGFQAPGSGLQHVEFERRRPVGGTSPGIVTGRVLWDARGELQPRRLPALPVVVPLADGQPSA